MPKRLQQEVEIARPYVPCQVRADSVDVEKRTVEVIWTTGAPVKRYDWRSGGYYMEVLDVSKDAIRMDRFDTMPLLDTHDNWSMEFRLGSVVPGSVRIEKGIGYCTIKLSRSEQGQRILDDLADGHPLNISVGYKVWEYNRKDGEDNELPTLTAIDWEPMEISAVPVPADAGAHSRSDEKSERHRVLIRQDASNAAAEAVETKEPIMDKRKAAKELKGGELTGFALGLGLSRKENETDEALSKRLLAHFDQQDEDKRKADEAEKKRKDDEAAAEAKRKEEEAANKARNSNPESSESERPMTRAEVDEATRAASNEAAAAERKRAAEIRSIARQMGFEDKDFTRSAIDDGMDVQKFRNLCLDKVIEGEERTPTETTVDTRGGLDETVTRRQAAVNALLHRADPSSVELTDAGRGFYGLSLINFAREYLAVCGENVRGMNDVQIAERALHGTTDFPILLGDVVRTRLLQGYKQYANTFQMLATRKTVTNFKEIKAARLGENPDLQKVNEHGEFPRGTLVEGSESYKIATYGRIIGVTRQMIINDDLDAFANVPNRWGRSVAKLEGDIVWGLITANAAMSSDSTALFHANHNNLAGAADGLDLDGLKLARKAFRKQTDIDGNRIDLPPKYLVTATDLEVDAQQLLGKGFTPTEAAKVIPAAIASLTPVAEYRLDGEPNAWYLWADPADVDGGLEYAYLAGSEEPHTEDRVGFDVDGVEWKVRHDFGAGLTDWRFAYKIPNS